MFKNVNGRFDIGCQSDNLGMSTSTKHFEKEASALKACLPPTSFKGLQETLVYIQRSIEYWNKDFKPNFEKLSSLMSCLITTQKQYSSGTFNRFQSKKNATCNRTNKCKKQVRKEQEV